MTDLEKAARMALEQPAQQEPDDDQRVMTVVYRNVQKEDAQSFTDHPKAVWFGWCHAPHQRDDARYKLEHTGQSNESAYQRGYLDGMAKLCVECKDRKESAQTDWEAVAADQAMTIAMMKVQLEGLPSDKRPWQQIECPVCGELARAEPPRKPWVGLTDDEIEDIWNRYCDEMGEASINDAPDIARAIRARGNK